MNLRSFLTRVPLVPVPPRTQLVARPAPSTLDQLYEEWQTIRKFLNSGVSDSQKPDWQVEFKKLTALEAHIANTPPVTIRDYALKILMADDGGDMSMNDSQLWLVDEARTITGIKPIEPSAPSRA